MKASIQIRSGTTTESGVSTDANNNSFVIDTTGGQFTDGVRPMQLLLSALGSCSIVDILIILQKQKQEVTGYHITVEGERDNDTVPALWKHIQLTISLTGNIDEQKANRAAELSISKYCSVAATLRNSGTNIEWTIQMSNA